MRLLISALAALALPAAAQDVAPLMTDRPDFTEGPAAVPFRAVQIELGVTAVSGPELLVRVGFGPGVELRIGAPDVVGGVALSEWAGAFLELAADALDASPDLLLHAGLSLLLAPLVQVDVHGGVGLTGDAPGALLGAGLSIRR